MTKVDSTATIERRKKILLTNASYSFVGYFTSLLLLLLAKGTGLTQVSYGIIIIIFSVSIFSASIGIYITHKKKYVSESFGQRFGIVQLIIWLAFFGTNVLFVDQIRYCTLILIYMALIFQVTTFSFVQSIVFITLTTITYLASSFSAILFLGQSGTLWKEIFHALCFLPSGVIVSFITKFFSEKSFELKKAKRISEDALDIIKGEMQLARKIQEEMIPDNTEENYISSLYKPMDEVGGDLFDFIKFRDSDNIGIFLSDVSGHGLPAAFITSMIKTAILQAGDKKFNPSELLQYINNLLYGRTAGNFITAFYGIYNPSKNSIIYSNAGHNHPYIIQDKIAQLELEEKLALAIFPNSSLKKFDKNFKNHEAILTKGSKLLLYTDGFTEARPLGGGDFFEDSKMFDIFDKSRHLPCNEFVDNIYQGLVTFRQGDSFDDDICLICLDIL